MSKITIWTAIFLLASSVGYGMPEQTRPPRLDTPNNLIYIVDDSANYMIPYIEQKIRNLEDAQHKRLYDTVASLNTLNQKATIRVDVVHGLLKIRELDIENAHGDTSKQKLFVYNSFLASYRSVLLIKINVFNDLLEFQFTLFTKDAGPEVNLQYSGSMSVFVDPRKPNYQNDIVTALNQVFLKANPSPSVSIKVNQDIANGIYNYTEHDTVTLEPIIEDKSWEVDRTYKWQQDTSDLKSARLDINKKDQVLTNLRPGQYHLSLEFNNGITQSKRVSIVIKVLPDSLRPNIRKINYVGHAKSNNNYFCFINSAYNTVDIYSYSNLIVGYGKDDSLKFRLIKENDPLHNDLQFKISEVTYEHGLRSVGKNGDFPTIVVDSLEGQAPSKFVVLKLKGHEDSILIIPPQPPSIHIPTQFEMEIKTSTKEFQGKAQYLTLNFYKIRRLYFHFGGEIDLATPINGPLEAGLGYTLPFNQAKVNICVTQGLYLNWSELSNNTSLNNFQEAYIDIPFQKIPISVKVGFRNLYFGIYDSKNNFTGHRSQGFTLLGIDYVISRKLSKQRISFTYAYHDSSVPYLDHQFAVGYGVDIFSARREK
jgi:hypothetical protein